MWWEESINYQETEALVAASVCLGVLQTSNTCRHLSTTGELQLKLPSHLLHQKRNALHQPESADGSVAVMYC